MMIAQVCDWNQEFIHFWRCAYLQQSFWTTRIAIVPWAKTITKMILNPNKRYFRFRFRRFHTRRLWTASYHKGTVAV
jgi:hypothetical protein